MRRRIFLILFFTCVLGLYWTAESRGFAFGGRSVPERINPDQLRSQSPGSWGYVYWYHGSRGK